MQLNFFEDEQINQSSLPWFEEILHALNIASGSGWPDRFGVALQSWSETQPLRHIRTLSLFSGGGGLDIAFHDAGFDIVEMVEIDSRYAETLRKNFTGKSKVTCQDIRCFVPEEKEQIDFIIGGPPCQTFSAAGRRAAGVAGTDDPRGTLFQEYIRLLTYLKPKGFLFENVYGITGAQNGRAWKEIQAAFKEAGYNIFFRVLDAADYGVPQHRERLFIVGLREGEFLFPYPTHGPDSIGEHAYFSAGEAIQGADITGAIQGIGGRYGHLLNNIPPGLNYSFYTKEMGHPFPIFSWRSKFSDFLYKADPERPVRTIKAQGGQYTGPFSWNNRHFTVPELKRLQTFPDTYELVGGRQVCIEQIGNSVPPQLGRILALSILDQVIGRPLPFQMNYLPQHKTLGFRQRKRDLTKIYSNKAQEALNEIQDDTKFDPIQLSRDPSSSQDNIRFLGKDFSWTNERVADSNQFRIDFQSNTSSWNISVVRENHFSLNKSPQEHYIEIYPSHYMSWPLKTERVKLFTTYLDQETFTALWKIFEEKVLEITGIADLVQLSGYYQYQPKIKATFHTLDSFTNGSIWQIVKFVTEGLGVGKQISGENLSVLWECNSTLLLEYLSLLREIGFEVRSNRTNPQMKSGDYLIPYIFPTLTPKSVQLRKSLRENYVY